MVCPKWARATVCRHDAGEAFLRIPTVRTPAALALAAIPAALALAFVAQTTGLSSCIVGPEYSQPDLERQALVSLADGHTLAIDPAADPAELSLVPRVNQDDRATIDVAGRIAEAARFRSALASYGTRRTGATVTLVGPTVERRGAQLILRTIEDATISYEVNGRWPRPEDAFKQRIPHEFVFEVIGARWTLVLDRPAPGHG